MKRINEHDIKTAQNKWSEIIVDIGKAYLEKQDYKTLAKKMLTTLYGYKEGIVLFKPTKAGIKQFRLNFDSALSYFIGENDDYPEDHGFALQTWSEVRFENAGIIIQKNYALAMGNYYFTDINGNDIKAEYTLGYFRAANGFLKINLHHSSLPYKPYKIDK